MNQKKIGIFIAGMRKEKGYTQKQLADLLGLSEKTISKWECGNGLPEVSFMMPLCKILGISVNELLMGEQYKFMDMMKEMGLTMEHLVKQIEFEQLKYRLFKMYQIDIESAELSEFGAGAQTYIVRSGRNKYIVKYFAENSMNHVENEEEVCEFLIQHNIPVCQFIKNCQGNFISSDENGRRFHVQHFIAGTTYHYHEAPEWLMAQSAEMLGRIHTCLKNFRTLPEGIGASFFRYRTIEGTLESYEQTLKLAQEKGDHVIAGEIISNMQILKRMPDYTFDLEKLTLRNTHGDFNITQLICGENQIHACIDWTTACVHPVIWEVIRSYIYASPFCAKGEINIEDLKSYVKTYMKFAPLTQYDLENMGKLFFYFTAVCNFYGQYYEAMTDNRGIYLKQAELSTKLLIWFEKNIEQLTTEMVDISSNF